MYDFIGRRAKWGTSNSFFPFPFFLGEKSSQILERGGWREAKRSAFVPPLILPSRRQTEGERMPSTKSSSIHLRGFSHFYWETSLRSETKIFSFWNSTLPFLLDENDQHIFSKSYLEFRHFARARKSSLPLIPSWNHRPPLWALSLFPLAPCGSLSISRLKFVPYGFSLLVPMISEVIQEASWVVFALWGAERDGWRGH